MIHLKSIDSSFLDFWVQKSENIFLIIENSGEIVEKNHIFKEFATFDNLFDIVTKTHQTKFLQLINRTIKEKSPQNGMIHLSLDSTNIEDIPKSYNIFTQSIDNDKILIILEPLPALNHNEAKAYFRMINDYSSMSRRLQKTEFLLNKKNDELTHNIKKIEYLSDHDALTTLYNRRKIFILLTQEINRAKRQKLLLSIVMFDIDNFKIINDTYGHQAGDKVLQSISKVFIKQSRDYESIGRYGGEEFLGILPNTDISGAFKMADRLRVSIKNHIIDIGGNQKISIQISLGVSQLVQSDSSETLVQRADSALYKAKETGRDKVVKGIFKQL